jgi:WD repeat-containing protein 55
LGPLTIFDRAKGYADCVDRFIGHPHSVETIVLLSSSPLLQNTIATGSSDGLIRVVQLHPSKFLGVIAAHNGPEDPSEEKRLDATPPKNSEGFPVERIKLDRKEKWLGSISHDEILKLTDVEGALEASEGDEGSDPQSADEEERERSVKRPEVEGGEQATSSDEEQEVLLEPPSRSYDGEAHHSENNSDSSEPVQKEAYVSKKRRRKERKREEAKKRRKGHGPSNTFFADL